MEKRLTAKSILKKIEDNKNNLIKCEVKRIGLFGSFLKGKQNDKSDIDFIVEFNKSTFDNYMDLKFFWRNYFTKNLIWLLKKV